MATPPWYVLAAARDLSRQLHSARIAANRWSNLVRCYNAVLVAFRRRRVPSFAVNAAQLYNAQNSNCSILLSPTHSGTTVAVTQINTTAAKAPTIQIFTVIGSPRKLARR